MKWMLHGRKFVWGGEQHRRPRLPYGVRKYVPKLCGNGLTLFSACWGNLEVLIDMQGLVAHVWNVRHSNVAQLLDDGDLLTHDCGRSLVRLDPDSRTVWCWEGDAAYDDPTHHDFYYDEESEDWWTLASREVPAERGLFAKDSMPASVRNDYIIRVDAKGRVRYSFGILEHLEDLATVAGIPRPLCFVDVDGNPRITKDWAHANSIELLPDTPLGRRDSRFRKGNVLFSLKRLDTIAILDPRSDRITWAYGPGSLDGQHQPTMLQNGNILLFDNGPARGYSRVVELDPVTMSCVWEYSDQEVFSPKRSGVQRLDNGNTFICEGDAGRFIEVTPDKETVWDYVSPFVAQGPHHMGRRVHRATRYSYTDSTGLFNRRLDRVDGEVDDLGRPVHTYSGLMTLYLRQGPASEGR